MELKDAISGRRSIRKYKSTKLSEEDIRYIMNSGIIAPSGMNIQPWYFVAIQNEEAVDEIKEMMRKGSPSFKPILDAQFSKYPQVISDTVKFVETFGGAPFIVLAFIRKPDFNKSMSTLTQSVSAAIENMLLAAYDRGIGSCWLTAPIEAGVSGLLKEKFAPDKGDFVALLTFGYPDEEPKMPRRREGVVEYIL